MISLIIPAYNVENYIEECLTSVCNQTEKEIEILVIDDGSTDNTAAIIHRFQNQDPRVCYFFQENQGLSAARNTGLSHAKGDYIFFLDSDDYLEVSTLAKLKNTLEQEKADVVACGIQNIFEDRSASAFTRAGSWTGTGKEAEKLLMTDNSICTVAWNKLYKKSLWTNQYFPIGKIHEDEYTVYKVIYEAARVVYLPELLYQYRQRSGSIMTQSLEKGAKDRLEASRERIQWFAEREEEELILLAYEDYTTYLKYLYRNTDKKREYWKLYHEAAGMPYAKKLSLKKRFLLFFWDRKMKV